MKKRIGIALIIILAIAGGLAYWLTSGGKGTKSDGQRSEKALAEGNWSDAITLLTEQLAETPDDPGLLYARAAAYLAQAKDSYNLAAAFAVQGEAERAEKEVAKADEHFDAARSEARHLQEISPEQTDAVYLLGCIDLYQGQWYSAIDTFTQVIKQDPERADAWQRRGEAYDQIGDSANAIMDLKKAASLHYISTKTPDSQAPDSQEASPTEKPEKDVSAPTSP